MTGIGTTYATAASTARIRIGYGGTNYFNSDYHTGNDQWELLEVEGTLPSTATTVQAVCEVAAGAGVGRFDAGWLTVGPVHRYTLPTSILRLHRIYQQDDELHPDRLYVPVFAFTSGRRLRLVGKGLLTTNDALTVAGDDSTVEIGVPQVNLLVEYAAMLMNQLLAQRAAQAQRDRYDRGVLYWREKVNQHLERYKTGGMAAQLGNAWRVEEDSTSRYLVLPQWRA